MYTSHSHNDSLIENFKHAIENSRKIVGFTGAGISTESGIPDYRSKGGIWDKYQLVLFDEFLSDEKKRILYWQRKQELWKTMKNALPNKGHMFLKISMTRRNFQALSHKILMDYMKKADYQMI